MSNETSGIPGRKPYKNADNTPIDLNSVIQSLPEDKREIIQGALLAISESRTFSGPLPAPEDFAEYEKVLPGATDRIMKMTEKQVEHRIESEKKIIDNKFRQSGRGQIIGAILVGVCIIASVVLGLYGHDWLAGCIGVTTVIGVAVVFVLNKNPSSSKADEEDAE